jgi:hypothetical protein
LCRRQSRFREGGAETGGGLLRTNVAGIQLIKKDPSFAEKSLAKWLRETDPAVVKANSECVRAAF